MGERVVLVIRRDVPLLACSLVAATFLLLGDAQALGEYIHIYPDDTGDYETNQLAIDAASEWDEVVLADGTYTGPGTEPGFWW